MTVTKLVIRNIGRRRGRFVFTLLGISIGIASFVTFLCLGGSLKDEITRESAALGAHLVVTPKGSCAYEMVSILTGEQLPTTITMEEVRRISAITGLTAVPFLTEKTAINNRPVPLSGVVTKDMQEFKRWQIEKGSYFSSADEAALVIGAATARQFNLKPGDMLTVRGERLPIRGVLKETGNREDLTLFVPLPVAQRLFKVEGKVSYVAVKLADPAALDEYTQKIKDSVGLGVVSDKQMLKSVISIIGTVNVTLQLIAAVAVLAAAFGIINTMMTATYERKREIGILQSLGAKQQTIFAIFMLESGFYGLLGGVVGIAGGIVFSVLAAPMISQNAFTAFVKGTGSAGVPDIKVIAYSLAFSILVSLMSGLYPAWRASRLSPVEAISYE